MHDILRKPENICIEEYHICIVKPLICSHLIFSDYVVYKSCHICYCWTLIQIYIMHNFILFFSFFFFFFFWNCPFNKGWGGPITDCLKNLLVYLLSLLRCFNVAIQNYHAKMLWEKIRNYLIIALLVSGFEPIWLLKHFNCNKLCLVWN